MPVSSVSFSAPAFRPQQTRPTGGRVFAGDLFERLAPNQSRRPMGAVLGRLGVPVRRDSRVDHALQGCFLGFLAAGTAGLSAPYLGVPYFPLMLGVLLLLNIVDVCGPRWARFEGV